VRTRHNNLRCFPSCGRIHRETSFCGRSVEVKVLKAAVPSAKAAIIFGEFRRAKGPLSYHLNERISQARLKQDADKIELGEYVNMNEKHYRFVFTPNKKWRYDAKIPKQTELHVFTVYLVSEEVIIDILDSKGFRVIPVWKAEDKAEDTASGGASDDRADSADEQQGEEEEKETVETSSITNGLDTTSNGRFKRDRVGKRVRVVVQQDPADAAVQQNVGKAVRPTPMLHVRPGLVTQIGPRGSAPRPIGLPVAPRSMLVAPGLNANPPAASMIPTYPMPQSAPRPVFVGPTPTQLQGGRGPSSVDGVASSSSSSSMTVPYFAAPMPILPPPHMMPMLSHTFGTTPSLHPPSLLNMPSFPQHSYQGPQMAPSAIYMPMFSTTMLAEQARGVQSVALPPPPNARPDSASHQEAPQTQAPPAQRDGISKIHKEG